MTKPPHLLHVLAAASRGGCERACEHICRYLREAQHTVLVLGTRGEMSALWEQAGARVEHLNLMVQSRRVLARRLDEAVQALPPTNGAVLWHGMAEQPVILHALPPERGPVLIYGGNPASSLSAATDWRYLLAEWFVYPHRHDPLYVPCSRYVADTFDGSRYLRRFRRQPVTNGVDPLPNDRAHVPRPLDAATDTVTIGMLARLDAIKDHATLLRAFAKLRWLVPRARLELAGDGDQLAALQTLASELGVTDAVRFLGTVSDVYGLLRRWDLFAYATTQDEGFGIALAEGLMCGLPTVVTDVGPVREVGGEPAEGTVVYVPPHDPEALAEALTALAGDLPRRRALAAAARRRAQSQLSAEVFAARYAALFEQERQRLGRPAADYPPTDSLPADSAHWIVCQLGAREHYAIPRALHQAGRLALLVTDIWCGPELTKNWLGGWLRRLPRLDTRYEPTLATVPIAAFSKQFILLAALRKLLVSRPAWGSWLTRIGDRLYQRLAARRLARVPQTAPISRVFAYSYSARDLFRVAKHRGWTTVLGQINPGPREEEIVSKVYWAETGVPGPLTAPSYWKRWREECSLADAIVVNSEWSHRLLVEAGIAPAKLHVVPLSYEPPAGAATFQRRYPDRFTPERPLRVLYLGAAHLRKGIQLLLRAAGRLAEEGVPAEFTVVGRDEIPGGLPGRLPTNMRWVAEVDRKATAAFYQGADVFVLPTFSDGFALTLLEAQAWKLPAIVSRRCGQVVEDGVNGWILEEIDDAAICQVLHSCLRAPELLRDRAARAVDLEQFSLAAICRQMQALGLAH